MRRGESGSFGCAIGQVCCTASGHDADRTFFQLHNPVPAGLGNIERAVFPAQAHRIGEIFRHGGHAALGTDTPYGTAAGIRHIQITVRICCQTGGTVEGHTQVSDSQFLFCRGVEGLDAAGTDEADRVIGGIADGPAVEEGGDGPGFLERTAAEAGVVVPAQGLTVEVGHGCAASVGGTGAVFHAPKLLTEHVCYQEGSVFVQGNAAGGAHDVNCADRGEGTGLVGLGVVHEREGNLRTGGGGLGGICSLRLYIGIAAVPLENEGDLFMGHGVVHAEGTGIVPQDNPLAVGPGNGVRIPLPCRYVCKGRRGRRRRFARQPVQYRDHHGAGQGAVRAEGGVAGAGHQIVRLAVVYRFRVGRACRYVRVPAGRVAHHRTGAGIIMDVGGGKGGIIGAGIDGVPLVLCTAVVNIGQIVTAVERQILNPGNTVRDGHIGQVAAELERTHSQTADAVENRHAGQTAAASKRTHINSRDTAGNRHAGQTAAAIERPIANTGDTVGNGHTGQAAAAIERLPFNFADTAGNRHAFHVAAAPKRALANPGDTVGDLHTGQTAAVIECRSGNTGNTVRNGHAGQTGTTSKHRIANIGDALFNDHRLNFSPICIPRPLVAGNIVRHRTIVRNIQRLRCCVIPVAIAFFHISAAQEMDGSRAGNGIRHYRYRVPLGFCTTKINIGQLGTRGKRTCTNGSDTCRNGHTSKSIAEPKCLLINCFHTVRDNHIGQAVAMSKCTGQNTGNP